MALPPLELFSLGRSCPVAGRLFPFLLRFLFALAGPRPGVHIHLFRWRKPHTTIDLPDSAHLPDSEEIRREIFRPALRADIYAVNHCARGSLGTDRDLNGFFPCAMRILFHSLVPSGNVASSPRAHDPRCGACQIAYSACVMRRLHSRLRGNHGCVLNESCSIQCPQARRGPPPMPLPSAPP